MITNAELDKLGEAEIQLRFGRGDWVDTNEIRIVQGWLRKAHRELRFIQACERARKTYALRTIRLSTIGAAIALLSLLVSIIVLVRTFR